MDWLKLFALLVAVASVRITAEGPKKKIRIHLPQKVKHIHHHKKIYIMNHPAHSYAPAYLSGVKGAVALPSNIGRPSVASIVPFNSVELYDETRSRLPGVAQAASKLLPLYRARGHYGPQPSEADEEDFELAAPQGPNDIYSASGYPLPVAAPLAPIPATPAKQIRIVKSKDFPHRKYPRKVKNNHVVVRNRAPAKPQPPPQQPSEEEHPVSYFHEQFYSDLDEAGTIKKIKKPQRIEKIIDGDTEHIHTYSEEHIHKVVFDDDSKVTGVVGVDPVGSMSTLNAAHPLVPLKNAQTLVAIPTDSLANLAVMGSMGTPSHLEYAAYNPRDVTHDHIYHDHGEIPSGVDVKDSFRLPPKISYNSKGYRVTGDHPKRLHSKRYGKVTKSPHDFSYYETIYAPVPRQKKVLKPTTIASNYDISAEISSFKPIPAFKLKEGKKHKNRNNIYYNKPMLPNFQLQEASVPAPFSVSSTVVHDYEPKGYAPTGPSPQGFLKITKHSPTDYRDSFNSDLDYDAYASSSNIHMSEDKRDVSVSHQGKNGKKSVSTQNISFGGQDRQTFVDHLAASASNNDALAISELAPSALEGIEDIEQTTNTATPTPEQDTSYTIKENSPFHQYYRNMALQALHNESPGSQHTENPDATNESYPQTTPTPDQPEPTTPGLTIQFYKIQSTDAITEPNYMEHHSEPIRGRKRKESPKGEKAKYSSDFKEFLKEYRGGNVDEVHGRHSHKYYRSSNSDSSSVRENPKYGDKI